MSSTGGTSTYEVSPAQTVITLATIGFAITLSMACTYLWIHRDRFAWSRRLAVRPAPYPDDDAAGAANPPNAFAQHSNLSPASSRDAAARSGDDSSNSSWNPFRRREPREHAVSLLSPEDRVAANA